MQERVRRDSEQRIARMEAEMKRRESEMLSKADEIQQRARENEEHMRREMEERVRNLQEQMIRQRDEEQRLKVSFCGLASRSSPHAHHLKHPEVAQGATKARRTSSFALWRDDETEHCLPI